MGCLNREYICVASSEKWFIGNGVIEIWDYKKRNIKSVCKAWSMLLSIYRFKLNSKFIGRNTYSLLPIKHRKTTISEIWREKEIYIYREREGKETKKQWWNRVQVMWKVDHIYICYKETRQIHSNGIRR